MKRIAHVSCLLVSTLLLAGVGFAQGDVAFANHYSYLSEPNVEALEELGKRVFFDNISQPDTQSCSSCHNAAAGWTSGNARINRGQVVVPGAAHGRNGNRKPPSIAYASFSPTFGDSNLIRRFGPCADGVSGLSCAGGVFADGRATGNAIGDEVFGGNSDLQAAYSSFLGPMADQALGPFHSDVEQNVPDGADNGLPGAEFVCRHVKNAEYAELYTFAWGEWIDCREPRVDTSFKRIAVAISAWEQSSEVNSFSSWRDQALAQDDDDTPGAFPLMYFTDKENLGHDLFYGSTSELNPTGKNANCSFCHSSTGIRSDGDEPEQTYSDHVFHNLGLPPNYQIASFDPNDPDFGLSEFTAPEERATSGHAGSFRTPTLRNVDRRRREQFTKAYMHNGYFKSLEDVVHFYNTATLKLDPIACPPGTTARQARARDCWPAPEVDNGLRSPFVGDLGLTPYEEAALVAYMKTLSDTQQVRRPRPYKRSRGKFSPRKF